VNLIVIVAAAWLVIGWLGLVVLIVKLPRSRRLAPRRSPRRHRRGVPVYWGGAGGSDDRQDATGDDWGGDTWGGHDSGGWGGGSWGGDSGGDSGGGGGD